MGVTQRLGTIPLAIFTDASNNIGIGGSPSGSFKFEVTGTSKFSSRINLNASSGFSELYLKGASSTTGMYLFDNGTESGLWKVDSGYMAFATTNTERLRIESTGNIQITTNNVALTQKNAAGTGTVGLLRVNSSNKIEIGDGGTINPAAIVIPSGNVGIGTNNPSDILHAYSSLPRIIADTSTRFSVFNLYYQGSEKGAFYLDNQNKYIITEANGDNTYQLLFRTAGTEKMRITTETGTANVCIGTTSSPQANTGRGALTINGSSSSIVTFATGGGEKGYVYANGTDMYYVNSYAGGGRLYCQNSTGGVYLTQGATSWTANSDERLKDITGNIENAVDSLMTLRAVKHTWKADEDKVEKLALIAQDVEKVFPQIVDKGKLPSKPNEEQTDETEYLGVRYQELIPVLVKAIQELSAKVEALENK